MDSGRPTGCHHSNYEGPERREGERRATCDLHSGIEKSIESSHGELKDLQSQACRKIDKIMVAMDTKVPMKLFYVMIGLVVAILGFQWTTYERVNTIALSNQKATGELKLSIEHVSSEVKSHQDINKMKLDNLTKSVDQHQVRADKEIGEIKSGIKEVKKDIQAVKRKIEE